MSDDPKCVAGCVPFYGGEKRHHKDCPYYPESLTKLNADRIEELEAKLATAMEALGGVMVGGNHLATILPDSFPPAETEPLIALEKIGYGYDFEVWCCWRSIMLARTTLAELTGGKP